MGGDLSSTLSIAKLLSLNINMADYMEAHGKEFHQDNIIGVMRWCLLGLLLLLLIKAPSVLAGNYLTGFMNGGFMLLATLLALGAVLLMAAIHLMDAFMAVRKAYLPFADYELESYTKRAARTLLMIPLMFFLLLLQSYADVQRDVELFGFVNGVGMWVLVYDITVIFSLLRVLEDTKPAPSPQTKKKTY